MARHALEAKLKVYPVTKKKTNFMMKSPAFDSMKKVGISVKMSFFLYILPRKERAE